MDTHIVIGPTYVSPWPKQGFCCVCFARNVREILQNRCFSKQPRATGSKPLLKYHFIKNGPLHIGKLA